MEGLIPPGLTWGVLLMGMVRRLMAGVLLMGGMVWVMLLIHLTEGLPLDLTDNLALVEGEDLAEAGERDVDGKLATSSYSGIRNLDFIRIPEKHKFFKGGK